MPKQSHDGSAKSLIQESQQPANPLRIIRYAGVGSRETPREVLTLMADLAQDLAKEGWVLRSGGADGADSAFEWGCDLKRGEKEIILPWPMFNGNLSPLILPREGEVLERATLIAQQHNYWPALTLPARKLHTRNVLQVMGVTLDEPADCVICWTKGGKVVGGTATAIKVAKSLGIPVFNFYSRSEQMQFKAWRK